MAQRIHHRLWQSFLRLNLYKKPSSDISTAPQELLSTRLYVCSLALAVLIIAIVATFLLRTINNTEYSPSPGRFSYLANKYPATLYCPCSTIGIAYDTFVSTRVRFHQVCSSQFVQETWIDQVFAQRNNASLETDDFRTSLTFFWQVIAGLCKISNTTWYDVLASFNATLIFNPVVVTEQTVRMTAQASLSNAIYLARTKLNRNLLAIRRMLSGNQIVSGLATNFHLRYPPDNAISPRMSPRTYGNCSCTRSQGCPHPATIYDTNGNPSTILGMIADCFVMDGALASTLECYYNRSCLSLLHPSFALPIQPLATSLNKYFTVKSTVETLLNEIMIDELISDIRFDLFYSQCNPSFCFYSYTRRFDILFIVTTLIGIYGGVSLVLRTIAPFLAAVILRRKSKHKSTNKLPQVVVPQQRKLSVLTNYLRTLSNTIRTTIVNFNVFESQTQRTPAIIFRQILLTRLFVLLLIISSIAAGFYIFLPVQSQVITIKNPSLTTYQQLYRDHGDALQCPCSQKSISYSNFLNVTFKLQQVCSSDLVSTTWLNYLESFDPINLPEWAVYGATRDFRTMGNAYFQLLAISCAIAINNIKDAQNSFANTRFVNDYVLAQHLFIQQTNAIIQLYINSTITDFRQTASWMILASTGNYFLTGTNTNSYITVNDNDIADIGSLLYSMIANISHENIVVSGFCSCPQSLTTCFSNSMLYTTGTQPLEYELIFEGLPITCLPLATFLSSQLSWLYDQNYLEIIRDSYARVIHTQSSPNINSLNASLPSEFQRQGILTFFYEMFTESSVHNETYFDLFYNHCAPISCSYTVLQRRDLIVVFLLLISICGGLNQILHILVYTFGKLIFFLIDWWNNHDNEHPRPSIITRLRHLFHSIYKTIINLNLYEAEPTDEIDLRQQKLYTRVYAIVFASALGVLLFYTAIIERSVTKTHLTPSIEDYEHLHYLYSESVSCPCKRISIPYDEFVTELRANAFHQACNNDADNITVTKSVSRKKRSTFDQSYDVINYIGALHNAVSQICELAKQTTISSTDLFIASPMFVKNIMPSTQFYNEINTTLMRFQRRIPIEFIRTLNLIRTTIQGNALMTVFSTNWQIIRTNQDLDSNAFFYNVPVTYVDSEHNTSCSCATVQTCTVPTQFFNLYDQSYFTVDSMRVGCYFLEAIFQSSFACFYDPICALKLFQAYGLADEHLMSDQTLPGFTPAINPNTTRFNVNDTIETLANELFIESWLTNVSYERFFNSCAPSQCTYRQYYRFDATELLTTFLSVYAGLSFGIRIIVPYLIRFGQRIRNRLRIVPREE